MADSSKNKKRNYIFVVGGVISGVGKGIASSSIARTLLHKGFRVTALKIDPYVNVDAGTMNPTEHGEVFVLPDGDETDQDMGNYERFLNTDLTRINYMTTGRVYQSVIKKERNMYYKGKCVEVVPHVPMEVMSRIEKAGQKANADFVIIEVGGTVGEYQNILFLEALRMMKTKHDGRIATVLVSFLPIPSKVGEMKTKPTQIAVRTLNAAGIQPDMIIARSTVALDKKRKQKISMFCNIPMDHVVSAPDVESIYDIPANFEKEGIGNKLCEIVGSPLRERKKLETKAWDHFVSKLKNGTSEIKIAVVGKYFETGSFLLSDSYLSVIEAIKFSSAYGNVRPKLTWFNSADFEKNSTEVKKLKDFDGILIPGGFGDRGIEGKLKAIRFVRENKIPYFGLCYGMQLMVVEYARNVAGINAATSREINPEAKNLVVDIMLEQKKLIDNNDYGNTMRLGSYPCVLVKGTIASDAYNSRKINERHRHRYEISPDFIALLEDKGLVFSGKSPDGRLMEIAELSKKDHPFFLGTQFHPEFQARPLSPHPLFDAFVAAAKKHAKSKIEKPKVKKISKKRTIRKLVKKKVFKKATKKVVQKSKIVKRKIKKK